MSDKPRSLLEAVDGLQSAWLEFLLNSGILSVLARCLDVLTALIKKVTR